MIGASALAGQNVAPQEMEQHAEDSQVDNDAAGEPQERRLAPLARVGAAGARAHRPGPEQAREAGVIRPGPAVPKRGGGASAAPCRAARPAPRAGKSSSVGHRQFAFVPGPSPGPGHAPGAGHRRDTALCSRHVEHDRAWHGV